MITRQSVFTRRYEYVIQIDEEGDGSIQILERKPVTPREGLMGRAASWAMAELSLRTQGPLNEEQFKQRMDACLACDARDAADGDLIGFCKDCGCGRSSRAALTVKGRMPAAKCPRGKWAVNDGQSTAGESASGSAG